MLLRSERSLSNDLAAAEKAVRADIAALSVQVEALKPPIPEASPLKAARPAVRAMFEDPRPQMAPDAVSFLADRLTPEMTVLEWGGGSSTPYLCERVGVLHTVEASPEWALVLLDYMSQRPDLVDHWRFHYVGANWTSVRASRRRNGGPMPQTDVRRRLEDDYAALIADAVDVLVVDGSARQRTVARLADYVQRDRPLAIVVNAMETDYVAGAMAELDLAGYDCHAFSGTVTALDGTNIDRCTKVWVRRHGDDSSAETVHQEITTVWESHDDEQYRQDQSHWRGVGRWDEQKWAELGHAVMQRMEELHHAAGREWNAADAPVLLEWGPGGAPTCTRWPTGSARCTASTSRRRTSRRRRGCSPSGRAATSSRSCSTASPVRWSTRSTVRSTCSCPPPSSSTSRAGSTGRRCSGWCAG